MTFAMTPLAISSSALRELSAANASIRYLAPDPVVEFVRSHRIYSIGPEPAAAVSDPKR
jgi:nicotinic acid mononucleotide adenylyltransferase